MTSQNRKSQAAPAATPATDAPSDFIREMVSADVASGRHGTQVVTRFPPEPNGYPHIGHAKSICLNFGVAMEHGGRCHLRFDDTNPTTESVEFVEAIQRDVRWLGFDWGEHLYFASDYFEQLYEYALTLIRKGLAYVDSLSEEEIREYRGTVTEAGRDSPYRERSVEENLGLFQRMRDGEFAEGEHVLRARIDMAASNMKMRDPLLYRIRLMQHYRTGDAWCIYPMYDFAHCLSDAIEGVTHSLCTLEFENNRDVYDWVLRSVDIEPPRPEQTEFARLALSYTVMSKRKLAQLVADGTVQGWDDPRMPTLSGLRRRGYTPRSIRAFCERIGVAKNHAVHDVAHLEHAIRDDLNARAPRVLAVLKPLKVVIHNYPEGPGETLDAPYFPHDIGKEGSRPLPFGRELYIDRADFLEDPPKKFFRLAPGREVRLRHAYIIRCDDVVRDEQGEISELRCSYDADSLSSGRRVKGTIQWVPAQESLIASVRLYDRLFAVENPDPGKGGPDFRQHLNPSSLQVVEGCRLEPSLAAAEPGSRFQFERLGYFYLEPESREPGSETLIFNRIVTLRDSWAKTAQSQKAAAPDQAKAHSATSAKGAKRRAGASQQSSASSTAPARQPTAEELARREHFANLGVARQETEVLAANAELATLFAAAAEVHPQHQSLARWTVNELVGELKGRSLEDLPLTGQALGQLVQMVDRDTLTQTAAKEVLVQLINEGGDPAQIVAERGLERLQDTDKLAALVDQVLTQHPQQVTQYQEGKSALLGFFVGKVMQASRGRAEPQSARQLIEQALKRNP